MQVKLKEHSFKLLVERTQLKELTSHKMLLIMFQNLSALANICMSLPVLNKGSHR